ncbi:MAG: type II toxin-antitoxin system HipA family toxin [Gammaproteobacteria bacterium]|nr:type II toxin-antitoxin system HipA family toxin [Gammaproteobacteria bacterium]
MMTDLRTLPQRLSELDICIADKKSGHLLFEKGSYHYAYDSADSLPVSVTMQPQNQRFYNNGRLFPIFEMNIPEGYVRHRIAERLLRYVGKVSDMLFLALQQDTGIGALSYQSGLVLPKPTPEKLEDLLKWNEKGSAFEYLLDKYLLNTSVSGVQPKVMLNADIKGSVLFPNLIAKTGDVEYPHLPENEYLCMSMAKACGIAVPEFYLSDNKELFIMERFDLAGNERLGMEDFCVLAGKQSEQKYIGSYEMGAKIVSLFTQDQSEVERYFRYVAFSCLVGNGDAHLKNFALLYSVTAHTPELKLSPMYDVVNTTCYPTHDKELALKLNKSHAFPDYDGLIRFGRDLKIIRPAAILEQMADTISDHLNMPDLWDDLSFLKDAISASLSRACARKPVFVTVDVKRDKKRKSDKHLK